MDVNDLKAQAVKVIEALLDENTSVDPFAATPEAAAKLRKTQARFCNALTAPSFRLRAQIAEGPAVASVGHFDGTHTGVIDAPGLDFPATGKETSMVGAVMLQFDDTGKVTGYNGLFDFRDLLVQLGVLPVSVA
jgi:predicted ester cyclase